MDDETVFLELITAILTRAGFLVQTASNGKEALAQMERNKPDLVLLDLQMPIMDGFETACAIRKDVRFATLPVMVISIMKDSAAQSEALASGADIFLAKPVNRKDLLQVISRLLGIDDRARELVGV